MDKLMDQPPHIFIYEVEYSSMSILLTVQCTLKRSIHVLFSFFEKYLYEKPLNLVIFSILILLSINIYFSVFQFLRGGFIETDMWFFAYRIEEIAHKGVESLFITPYGFVDVHPPLYYVITVPLSKIGLSVLWIAALLRIITPLAVIYFLYKTTALLFDRTSAAVACFFMAIMPRIVPRALDIHPFSSESHTFFRRVVCHSEVFKIRNEEVVLLSRDPLSFGIFDPLAYCVCFLHISGMRSLLF
jgi:hypothetical protein